jgi:hypothetical protein
MLAMVVVMVVVMEVVITEAVMVVEITAVVMVGGGETLEEATGVVTLAAAEISRAGLTQTSTLGRNDS